MPNQISTSCTTFLPLSTMNGNECIGDSLNVINDNFTNTANNFCSLQTTLNTLTGTLNGRVTALSAFVKSLSAKDSNTVDLTFDANSYILSADIVNSSLGTVKLGQDVTTLGKRLLTSTTLVLSSLDDVQITSLQTNEVLKWNGSKWVNQVDSAGSLSGNLVVGDKIDIYVGGPANNDVNNWQINAGAVDSTELANNAVITTKIYNGAVTTSKLASATGFEAVVTETIRDNAITTAKISALAVTESRIGLNAISETKIVNNAVTNDKLATAPAFTIKGNPTSSTGTVQDIVAADNKVLVRTGGSLQFANVPNSATTGTRNADSNTLVLRDGSGNFSAGVVEASAVAFGFVGNLQGNALSATQAVQSLSANNAIMSLSANRAVLADTANQSVKLLTARRIELSGTVEGAANFDGTSNITITTLPGPNLTTNYFRATETYSYLYEYKINTVYPSINNPIAAANGLSFNSRPTAVWRRFNTVQNSASFASIKTNGAVYGSGTTYIEITQPGIYDIEASGSITGPKVHNIVLISYNATTNAYTTLAVGEAVSNDPDATDSGSSSHVRGRFQLPGGVNNGVALVHVYTNDESTAADVYLGARKFTGVPGTTVNVPWLTSLFNGSLVTATLDIRKIS